MIPPAIPPTMSPPMMAALMAMRPAMMKAASETKTIEERTKKRMDIFMESILRMLKSYYSM